jgi:hypothetical protein
MSACSQYQNNNWAVSSTIKNELRESEKALSPFATFGIWSAGYLFHVHGVSTARFGILVNARVIFGMVAKAWLA